MARRLLHLKPSRELLLETGSNGIFIGFEQIKTQFYAAADVAMVGVLHL
jgi:hypothetical protein